MAINLIFLIRNALFMVRIDGKDIYWNDKINGLQMLFPKPSDKALKVGGPLTKDQLNEYNMCKTEDELASFVIKDAKSYGAKLIKREVIK